MKIIKVALQGFRAFDESFELDLEGGKNLLLHGENGSGKSSIFTALKRFFEEQGDDIAKYRNLFSPEGRISYVRLHLKGKDSTGTATDLEFHWDGADGHPLPVPKDPATAPISKELRSLLVDAAYRSSFLDYRVLLRSHFHAKQLPRSAWTPALHDSVYGTDIEGLDSQLFDLVSLVVMNGVRVPVSGGGETTIGTLMRSVWEHRARYRYKYAMRAANAHANAFNRAFNAKLPELEAKLSAFLTQFEDHALTVKFRPVSLYWDKESLELEGATLVPDITFRGKPVTNHHQFLNEARLSALAICLFLAGAYLSDNDHANPTHPRFLVLDDALIGLELQNRVPILRILTSAAFRHYQIFLLTHDRVWFDLARGHLPLKDGWLHKELIADESTGHLIPTQKVSQIDLVIAKKHLDNSDLKAAAVYARSAFEWKLRRVCEDNGIKIPFKPDADKLGPGVLWDGIALRQREREIQRSKGSQVNDFVPKALEDAVETMRSTVLNKLSHTGSSGLVTDEVKTALATVQAVHAHTFP